LSADGVFGVNGLAPNWPAKIDLVVRGQCAGAGADGATDHSSFKGGTNHEAADRT
jgi:hypothetical protein